MADDALYRLVAGRIDRACPWPDPQRDRLLARILERHGDGVQAVLVYGSYLRGQRDTLLDFYVLLDGYRALQPAWQAALLWLLSPNVYQVQVGVAPNEARAKYALLTLGRFERAMRRDFHPYFWARFAQPAGLVYCRDPASRERVIEALAQAGRRFVANVVPRLPGDFTATQLVSRGLGLTYACELRTEPAGHATALFEHDAVWFEALVQLLAGGHHGYRATETAGRYRHDTGRLQRSRSSLAWLVRRPYGKAKSLLRLLKAALTFDGGFDYLLWKIARHSGQYIEPTARQRRHPLLFGWPLLWRLYRRGGFR
jgi:hypothetical protein